MKDSDYEDESIHKADPIQLRLTSPSAIRHHSGSREFEK